MHTFSIIFILLCGTYMFMRYAITQNRLLITFGILFYLAAFGMLAVANETECKNLTSEQTIRYC